MAKYVLLYHGGSSPESEEEGAKVMAAWGQWLGSAGDSLVDGGHPFGQRKQVDANGSVSDAGSAVNGYSIIDAGSIDEAAAFAKASPHLEAGGTVEVVEALDM